MFGNIANGAMSLNCIGTLVQNEWKSLRKNFPEIHIGEFVVMPNHVHGIIILNNVGARFIAPHESPTRGAINRAPTPTLGEIIRSFKARTAVMVNRMRDAVGARVWQRNYYEHIIRNQESLNAIIEYIRTNPRRWDNDPENDARTKTMVK